jgi:hypothetical protein
MASNQLVRLPIPTHVHLIGLQADPSPQGKALRGAATRVEGAVKSAVLLPWRRRRQQPSQP